MLKSTGADFQGGHSASYFKKSPHNAPTEAFANITATKMQNPTALATLQQIFPETLKIYDEMLPEMQLRK